MRALLPDGHWILRTAWLYGEHGPNFVRTMARLEAERETVDVVDDQVGQPTWTLDVARRVLGRRRRRRRPPGVYHATSAGRTTWYGLARAVFAPARGRPGAGAAHDVRRVRATRAAAGLVGAGARGLAPRRTAPLPHWEDALRRAAAETSLLGDGRRAAR